MNKLNFIIPALLFILGLIMIFCSIRMFYEERYCNAVESEYNRIKNQDKVINIIKI
jgi:hypothetical protein